MQKLKFLAPYIFGVACALPNAYHVQPILRLQDRCVTYEPKPFERFFASSSTLLENASTDQVSHLSPPQGPQNICELSPRAIRIVQAKVAEVLDPSRAEDFANFAFQFSVVIISQEDLLALLANQPVNTRDRSSIVGHYDPDNRLIYISSALPTSLDRLCTISHEFVHVAMDYFGGNYHLGSLRSLLIREGFPALVEDEIRHDPSLISEFGPSVNLGSYPRLRVQLSGVCNSYQGTEGLPCSAGFRAFMLDPNRELRSQ